MKYYLDLKVQNLPARQNARSSFEEYFQKINKLRQLLWGMNNSEQYKQKALKILKNIFFLSISGDSKSQSDLLSNSNSQSALRPQDL